MTAGASVAIVGIGETTFARRSESSVGELAVQAVRAAIADAGLVPAQVDGIVPVIAEPAADDIAAAVGMRRRFTGMAGYVPGAGALSAAVTAKLAIDAGLAHYVVVYLGYGSSRPGGPYTFHAKDPVKASYEMPFGFYGQPVYFAAWQQRYCHDYNVKPDDLAGVSMAARQWARLTPGAQETRPLSLSDYLASPMISSPLRKADCCLLTDGAAACVLTSIERARDLPNPPAVLSGYGLASMDVTMHDIFTQKADFLELGSRMSGPRAYASAGIVPGDIDVALIYDCFSTSLVLQMEDLGLCPRGEGFAFANDGHTSPGGSLPVNTHGGHLSYAYLPGVVHIAEAVKQIRGTRGEAQVRDAEVALVSALGGNDHASLVITKDR
jgi:acetyl-CoA acetyltransferase